MFQPVDRKNRHHQLTPYLILVVALGCYNLGNRSQDDHTQSNFGLYATSCGVFICVVQFWHLIKLSQCVPVWDCSSTDLLEVLLLMVADISLFALGVYQIVNISRL